MQRIDEHSDGGADGQCQLDEAGLHGVEAVGLAECLHDGGEEEEKYAPCEADPEGEEDDDGLGEEHLGGAHEGDLEHFEDGGFLEFGFGVHGAARHFAELLGTPLENDVAARFFEDEPEYGD